MHMPAASAFPRVAAKWRQQQLLHERRGREHQGAADDRGDTLKNLSLTSGEIDKLEDGVYSAPITAGVAALRRRPRKPAGRSTGK